jgi:hypothetical protein
MVRSRQSLALIALSLAAWACKEEAREISATAPEYALMVLPAIGQRSTPVSSAYTGAVDRWTRAVEAFGAKRYAEAASGFVSVADEARAPEGDPWAPDLANVRALAYQNAAIVWLALEKPEDGRARMKAQLAAHPDDRAHIERALSMLRSR